MLRSWIVPNVMNVELRSLNGRDKISHTHHCAVQGFKLVVLPGVVFWEIPHKKTASNREFWINKTGSVARIALSHHDDIRPQCSSPERSKGAYWSRFIMDGRSETEPGEENIFSPGTIQSNARRKKILVLVFINLAMRFMMTKYLEDMQVFLVTVNNFIATVQVMLAKDTKVVMAPRQKLIWRMPRNVLFTDENLLRAQSEKEFTGRLRVKPCTFHWICTMIAPFMQKKRSSGISVQNMVAVSLARLGTGNYLKMCGDLYGMSEATASIVVREFCKLILQSIRPLVVPTLTKKNVGFNAVKFEEKHGIPFIMGAIDCSHIPILAPSHDPASYYNRKGFYSAQLQAVVDTEALFWDWDFGWAGAGHDFTVFQQSRIGIRVLNGYYEPYKLIGDAAYPCRTWGYVPFKGYKEELPPWKQHWNFVQSSTRMAVERALGILKGRWRILLRKIEMPFEHVGPIVGASIVLHNLCIIHKDFVDWDMQKEAIEWLEDSKISEFGGLLQDGIQRIADYGVCEIGRSTIDPPGIFQREAKESVESSFIELGNGSSNKDEDALRQGMRMHVLMAKNLFRDQLDRDTVFEDGFYEEGQTEFQE